MVHYNKIYQKLLILINKDFPVYLNQFQAVSEINNKIILFRQLEYYTMLNKTILNRNNTILSSKI